MIIKNNPNGLNEISFETQKRLLEQQKQEELKTLKNTRKSPYKNFYQINADHSEDLMWLVKANSNAFRILLFLFDHMDNYNAVICSYQVFQEALDIGRTTASLAIKFLKEHGFIYIYKSGTSNVYVANPDIVWKSWGNNKQYCKFPANIILSTAEQEERSKVRDKRIKTVEIKK